MVGFRFATTHPTLIHATLATIQNKFFNECLCFDHFDFRKPDIFQNFVVFVICN